MKTQSRHHRMVIWKVFLWGLIPLFIGAAIGYAAYLLIREDFSQKLKSMEAEVTFKNRDLKLCSENESEQAKLRLALVKIDSFLEEAPNLLKGFSNPGEGIRQEAQIARMDARMDNLSIEVRRLILRDSSLRADRERQLRNYVLLWSHMVQEARIGGNGNEIAKLKSDLKEAEEKIFQLRNEVLDAKFEKSDLAGSFKEFKVESIGKSNESSKTAYELQKKVEELEQELNVCRAIPLSDKKDLAEINTRLRDLLKETVSGLTTVIEDKKFMNSIVPEVKALIRELNQQLEMLVVNHRDELTQGKSNKTDKG